MSDTYTTLNPGASGDSMDESAITYASAPTTRKRERLVIADNVIASHFAKVSPFGTLLVSQALKLCGGSFTTSSLDANVWTETLGVTGSSSLSGGIITLNPGLLATGSVNERSIKVGRFLPSAPNYFLGRFAYGDTGDTGNIRRIGAFTATDGWFFELNATTPRLVTRKASVDTAITSFNGDASTWAIDTNFHNYECRYSLGNLHFFVDGGWVHSASFPATTWAATCHLPISFESVNSGVVVGTPTLLCSIVSLARFGEHTGRSNYLNITTATTTVVKTATGTLIDIIANKKGTASAQAIIYDNTAGSGKIIGTLDLTNANIGGLKYECDFNTGLTIVTSGSNIDITVTWD